MVVFLMTIILINISDIKLKKINSLNTVSVNKSKLDLEPETKKIEPIQVSVKQNAEKIYMNGMILTSLFYRNNTSRDIKLYIRIDLLDVAGNVIMTLDKILEVVSNDSGVKRLETLTSKGMKTGRYKTKVTVWDGDPKEITTELLVQSISVSEIIYFASTDEFDMLDNSYWELSDKKLNDTTFTPNNIMVQNGALNIKLSKDVLSGGEIYSVDKQGYGIYEIRMKVPNVPSSITGFFMYYPPDFHSEIDMEVFNDSSGKLLLTTYADGKVSNESVIQLGFDPTQDFHDYRFEYSENQVVFYVDDQLVDSFNSEIPKTGMQLMINCWYPKWLEQKPPSEEKILFIERLSY
jgi:hypothetical protein